MLSVEKNILAFVSLVKSQRLYENYETEFADLCAQLPDDVAQISNTLITWCQQHQLYEELKQTLKALQEGSLPNVKLGSQPIRTPQQWIELISNSTRKPLPESPNPTANHESNQPNPGDSQS